MQLRLLEASENELHADAYSFGLARKHLPVSALAVHSAALFPQN